MKNFFKHLKVVTKHRYLVFKHCVKCGLFFRGLVHDLSKFSWVEFSESVKYFKGTGSPISKCREENGYSLCWLHHKGRNKHHIEYWYDNENKTQMHMPYKYAVECVCDKLAAAKTYNGKNYTPKENLNYWLKKKDIYQTSEETKEFFTKVFSDLCEKKEKEILNKKYLKNTYKEIVLHNKKDEL